MCIVQAQLSSRLAIICDKTLNRRKGLPVNKLGTRFRQSSLSENKVIRFSVENHYRVYIDRIALVNTKRIIAKLFDIGVFQREVYSRLGYCFEPLRVLL